MFLNNYSMKRLENDFVLSQTLSDARLKRIRGDLLTLIPQPRPLYLQPP